MHQARGEGGRIQRRGDEGQPLWHVDAVAHVWQCGGTCVAVRWHTCGNAVAHVRQCGGTRVAVRWHTCGSAVVGRWAGWPHGPPIRSALSLSPCRYDLTNTAAMALLTLLELPPAFLTLLQALQPLLPASLLSLPALLMLLPVLLPALLMLLPALPPACRLQTLGRAGLQQLQLDCHYLRPQMRRYTGGGGRMSGAVGSLLDEVRRYTGGGGGQRFVSCASWHLEHEEARGPHSSSRTGLNPQLRDPEP